MEKTSDTILLMMKVIKLVCLVILATGLSGCGERIFTITEPVLPTEVEHNELSQLIGAPREVIIEKLGPSRVHFTLDDREFLLFVSITNNIERRVHLVLLIPLLGPKDRSATVSLRCLLVEIDSDELFKQYIFEHTDNTNYRDEVPKCLKQFFIEDKLDLKENKLNLKLVVPPPSDTGCVINEEVQRAINKAWDQEGITWEAIELLFQVEAVTKPFICDSEEAKILADKAYQLSVKSN